MRCARCDIACSMLLLYVCPDASRHGPNHSSSIRRLAAHMAPLMCTNVWARLRVLLVKHLVLASQPHCTSCRGTQPRPGLRWPLHTSQHTMNSVCWYVLLAAADTSRYHKPADAHPAAALQKGLSESQQRRGKQRFTSRCHVQDICSVLLASMAAPSAGSIYNVADDDPSPRGEVMAYAQQVLVETGAALPLPDAPAGDEAASASAAEAQQQEQQSSPSSSKPGGRSRGSAVMEEKRVRNVKIKEQLGITLQYPTYREGITAIINGCTYPFDAADLAFLGVEQQGAGP